MRMTLKVASCSLFLILLIDASCASREVADNEEILAHSEWVGVWKLTEVKLTDHTIIRKPQPGYAMITDQYVSFNAAIAPRTFLPERPTNDHLATLFRSFSAYVAKYEMEGNTCIAKILVHKNPNTQDVTEIMDFRIEGRDLYITPKEVSGVPIENPFIYRFTRIE